MKSLGSLLTRTETTEQLSARALSRDYVRARREITSAATDAFLRLRTLPALLRAHRGVLLLFAAYSLFSLLPLPWAVVVLLALDLVAAVLLVRRPRWRVPFVLTYTGFVLWDASPNYVAGSAVRIYQMAAPAILVVLAVEIPLWSRATRRWPRARPGWRSLALAGAILAFSLLTVASIAWSISPRDTSVAAVGQISLLALAATYIVFCTAEITGLLPVLRALSIAAGIGSALALVQFLVAVAGGHWRVYVGTSGVPWPRPAGLMTEPDWACLVALLGAVMALWLRVRTRAPFWTIFVVVDLIVVVLSAARAAWLAALVAGALWVGLLGRKYVTRARLGLVLAGLGMAASAVLVLHPGLIERLDPRLLTGGSAAADNGSANSRVAVVRLVFDQGDSHLPWGAGAGALNHLTSSNANATRYVGGGVLNAGRGSTNVFATSWFDFGIPGLVVMLTLAVAALTLSWRLRRWDGGLSLVVSVVLLIDFEFNNGIRFGFVWLLLALLFSAGLRMDRGAREADRPGTVQVGPS